MYIRLIIKIADIVNFSYIHFIRLPGAHFYLRHIMVGHIYYKEQVANVAIL